MKFIFFFVSYHGRPRQIRMSNTFEPTAFETAISPYPSLITAIELNASGIDTPAATKVKPIETQNMGHGNLLVELEKIVKFIEKETNPSQCQECLE